MRIEAVRRLSHFSDFWAAVWIVFLFGVVGPSAVGKIIPLVQDYIREFGGSPVAYGLLISSIAIPSAALAIPSGLLTDRFGPKAILLSGVGVSVLANVVYILAGSPAAFQIARIFDGVAVAMIYTAGPAYLIAWASARQHAAAMSIWALYMPVGMSLGLVLGGMAAETEGWRNTFWAHGFCGVAVGALGLALLPDIATPKQAAVRLATQLRGLQDAYRHPNLLLLALAFGMIVCLGVGAGTALPNFISRVDNIAIGDVSGLMAVTNLTMIPGSLITGFYLVRRWRLDVVFAVLMVATLLLGMVIVFPGAGIEMRLVALPAWSFLSGACTATLMSYLPIVARDHDKGASASMLNQAGALATLASPPVWFAFTTAGDIGGLIIALTIVTAIATGAFVWVFHRLSNEMTSDQHQP